MPRTIDIRDLPARLTELLAQVSAGEEIVVVDGKTPRARLIPPDAKPGRTPGLHSGDLAAAPDFDAPLPEDFWARRS